jgi:hypothetical protein
MLLSCLMFVDYIVGGNDAFEQYNSGMELSVVYSVVFSWDLHCKSGAELSKAVESQPGERCHWLLVLSLTCYSEVLHRKSCMELSKAAADATWCGLRLALCWHLFLLLQLVIGLLAACSILPVFGWWYC